MTDLDVHLGAITIGDTRAFARWLAGAEGTVRDSLRSFATAVDVEAVLQEALLRVWQVAPRFEADGFANSLLRLSIRIVRSKVRRTSWRTSSERPETSTVVGRTSPS